MAPTLIIIMIFIIIGQRPLKDNDIHKLLRNGPEVRIESTAGADASVKVQT